MYKCTVCSYLGDRSISIKDKEFCPCCSGELEDNEFESKEAMYAHLRRLFQKNETKDSLADREEIKPVEETEDDDGYDYYDMIEYSVNRNKDRRIKNRTEDY